MTVRKLIEAQQGHVWNTDELARDFEVFGFAAPLVVVLRNDHLWTELSSQRYTTPLLHSWTAWLKDEMARIGSIVVAKGYGADVGVLTTSPEELDDLISKGVRERHLAICV